MRTKQVIRDKITHKSKGFAFVKFHDSCVAERVLALKQVADTHTYSLSHTRNTHAHTRTHAHTHAHIHTHAHKHAFK